MVFRSLRHKNFRHYYIGQFISLNGTWMQNIAQAWLVYRLTESSFYLGLVGFCSLIPVLFMAMFGGVLADRHSRRKLLIIIHVMAMSQALILALLTLLGWVTVWHVLILALCLGVVHALEIPVRQSFLSELVEKDDLPNAIALNSSVFNIARFAGPSIAGFLILHFGEGWVFLLNSLSFIVLLLMLLRIRTNSDHATEKNKKPISLLHGIRYVMSVVPIRRCILLVACISLMSASLIVLLPVFASKQFAGQSDTMGLLFGAMGAGALAGAIRLAFKKEHSKLHHEIGFFAILCTFILVGFSFTQQFELALSLMFTFGFAQTSMVASSNTFVQLNTPDHIRGRVMSVFSTMFIGLMPIGHLLGGLIAATLGNSGTIQLFAIMAFAASVIYLWRVVFLPEPAEPGP